MKNDKCQDEMLNGWLTKIGGVSPDRNRGPEMGHAHVGPGTFGSCSFQPGPVGARAHLGSAQIGTCSLWGGTPPRKDVNVESHMKPTTLGRTNNWISQ